jgi:membrane protease YdiL (CAAX protease family)
MIVQNVATRLSKSVCARCRGGKISARCLGGYQVGSFLIVSSVHEALSLRVENIYLYVSYKVVIATLSVTVAVMLSPLLDDFSEIVKFPEFKVRSSDFCLVLLFFVFVGLSVMCGIQMYSEQILADHENILLLIAVMNKPVLWMPVILLTILLSAIGEELVFRYIAISAIGGRFKKPFAVAISSAIWTMFHSNISMHLFVVGLFLGYFFLIKNSISLCIFLHFIYNVLIYSQIFYLDLVKKGNPIVNSAQYFAVMIGLMIITYCVIGFGFNIKKVLRGQSRTGH